MISFVRAVKEASPCTDCGVKYPHYVMDFDHIPGRGEKISKVRDMVAGRVSLEMVKAEIEKCELVARTATAFVPLRVRKALFNSS